MTILIETRPGQWVRADRVDAVEYTGPVDPANTRCNYRMLVGGTWVVGSTDDLDLLIEKINTAAEGEPTT
jgi:hypothetical protein